MASVEKDPDDGLPAIEAQEWAEEKHDYLRRYLDISREARRKFLGAGGQATYSELFSGPGRLFVKGRGRFIDGSPLVAWKVSVQSRTPFTHMHLGDEQAAFGEAAKDRLNALKATVTIHPLKAEAAAKRIVRQLPDSGLNVAFLDPFNLGDLPFAVIETFSKLRKIDLVIHVSAMDLIRQLPGAMSGQAT